MSAMFIRVASDLHLETRSGCARELLDPDERDAHSILVLAGDISSDPDQLIEFINSVHSRFYAVVYVAGNHEFWDHDMEAWVDAMDDRLAKYCLVYSATSTVKSFMVSNVRFICGTLWGDGCDNVAGARMLECRINDFKRIKGWSHDRMVAVNKDHRRDIERFLQEPFHGKTVVVTHHLPSHKLCAARFAHRMNAAFATDCDDLMCATHAPRLWIHGHSHDTHDRVIGNTRVLCNPAGYPEDSASEFNKYGKCFIGIHDV
jgi:predicted phosphodiesterase